jgi:hypothetical protein
MTEYQAKLGRHLMVEVNATSPYKVESSQFFLFNLMMRAQPYGKMELVVLKLEITRYFTAK